MASAAGDRHLVFASHEAVRRALVDQRFGNDFANYSEYDQYVIERGGRDSPALSMESRWLTLRDGVAHRRLRRFAEWAMARTLTAELEAFVETTARSHIGHVLGAGYVDIMSEVAHPMSMQVICEALGVPSSDRMELLRWGKKRGSAITQEVTERVINDNNRTMNELRSYFDEQLSYKLRNPGADLLSSFASVAKANNSPSREDLIALSIHLLSAGHLPAAAALATGTSSWLKRSDRAAKYASGLAVEEALRLATPIRLLPRVITTGLRTRSRILRRGEIVMLSLDDANRDPGVFPEPEKFDLGRTASGHLSFGHGPHYCLGARLARLEMKALLSEAVRIDPYRVEFAEATWVDSPFLAVPSRFEVNFPARSATGNPE